MKHLLTFCIGVALLSSGATVVRAETATTSSDTVAVVATTTTVSTTTTTPVLGDTMSTLLARIKELQTLINALKTRLGLTPATTGSTTLPVFLTGEMKEGMTSEEIRMIQQLLAADAGVYPAGRVTGFFGPMTKEAIMRFQTKHGLEVTGEITAETRAAFETIMADHKASGMYRFEMMTGDKGKFELKERVRQYCAAAQAGEAPRCQEMKLKYKWEDGKMEVEVETEDEDESEDDTVEDEDDDSEDDEDEDESDDEDEDESDDEDEDDENDDN
jgi:Putative peptidoglycan binding domain